MVQHQYRLKVVQLRCLHLPLRAIPAVVMQLGDRLLCPLQAHLSIAHPRLLQEVEMEAVQQAQLKQV